MTYKDNWIDYYDVLEVSFESTSEDIKKAYRKMAKQFHPDINDGDDTFFKKVNEAYDILGNDSKKKKYDEEYINRKNKDYVSDDEYQEEVDYDEVKKHYSKKEQKYAEEIAFKKLLEEELKKIDLILESKNDLILDAYLNDIDKRDYYETVKEFMNVGKEFIESLNVLAKEAYERNLLIEEDLINSSIDNLLKELNSVPLTIEEACNYIEELYIKEGIDKKIKDIINKSKNYVVNLKHILSSLHLNKILKMDYNALFQDKMNEGKKLLLEIENILKIIATTNCIEDEKLQRLRDEIGNIKSIMIWFPKNYEDALNVNEVYCAISTLNMYLYEFKIFKKKVERIIKIIKEHPTNHRCSDLYVSAEHMLDNNINKYKNIKTKYELFIKERSTDDYNIKELSTTARRTFSEAEAIHDEIKYTFSKILKDGYKYSDVGYFENDVISLEQKIECIKVLAELDKIVKVSKDLEYFYKDILTIWEQFINSSDDLVNIKEELIHIFKYLKIVSDFAKETSNYEKIKKKLIEKLIVFCSWNVAEISILKYALGDVLFSTQYETLTKVLVGLGLAATTAMFTFSIYDTTKTTYDTLLTKKRLQYRL